MADIARVGFSADTGDLDTARTKLKALKPAAAEAQRASEDLAKSSGKAGTALDKAAKAGANAGNALDKAARGATNDSKALDSVTKSGGATGAALNRAANEAYRLERAARMQNVNRAGIALQRMNGKLVDTRKFLNDVTNEANKADSALDRVSKPRASPIPGARTGANDNSTVKKSGGFVPTANIAAQFQDVGVTAAMGMSPFQIALQQGTQLVGVFQQMGMSATQTIKALGGAFASLFSPISLATIGLIALLAAGLQAVKWMELAKGALTLLADNLDAILTVLAFVGGAFALAFSPQIIAAVFSLTVAIGKGLVGAIMAATRALVLFSLANPFGAFILAIAAVLTAVYLFRDDFTRVFGFDIIKSIKDAADAVARYMIASYNTIKRVWEDIPNIAHDMVQRVKKSMNDLVSITDPSGKRTGGLFNFDIEKERGALKNAGNIYREEMGKLVNYSFTDKVSQNFDRFVKSASGKLRSLANSLGAETADDGKSKLDKAAKAKDTSAWDTKVARAHFKEMEKLMEDAKKGAIDLSDFAKQAMTSVVIAAKKPWDEWHESFKKAQDFARGTFKGLFTDLKSNLQEGQNLLTSFVNSVLNAINRVLDRVLDKATDALFDSIFGSMDFSTLFSAKGNAFGKSGVKKNAKGDAFTNQVVSSPTAFLFGKGGANLGIMGEAGDEAVMPLTRGPDGSLGVQMYGGGQGGGRSSPDRIEIVVRGEEGPMFRPTIEAISEQKAVEVTQVGLEQFNNELPGRFQQIANDERVR